MSESRQFLDWTSTKVLIGWFLVQCVLYMLPTGGQVSKGVELKCGRRLDYRMNGMHEYTLYDIHEYTLRGAHKYAIFGYARINHMGYA